MEIGKSWEILALLIFLCWLGLALTDFHNHLCSADVTRRMKYLPLVGVFVTGLLIYNKLTGKFLACAHLEDPRPPNLLEVVTLLTIIWDHIYQQYQHWFRENTKFQT